EPVPVTRLGVGHPAQDLGALRVALAACDQLVDGPGLDLSAPGLEQPIDGFAGGLVARPHGFNRMFTELSQPGFVPCPAWSNGSHEAACSCASAGFWAGATADACYRQ